VGDDSTSCIQRFADTEKYAGDRVRCFFTDLPTGDGTTSGGALEGSEVTLTHNYDEVLIEKLRFATRFEAPMTNQRSVFDMQKLHKEAHVNWWKDRFDVGVFNQLAGYTPQTNTKYTGLNAVSSVASGDIIRNTGETTDEGLDSGDTMSLDLLEEAVYTAKTRTYPIRPIPVGDDEYFIYIGSPRDIINMRRSTTTGQWLDITKAMLSGGSKEADNRIRRGFKGVYNNVIILESTRVPYGVDSSTSTTAVTAARRGLFLGCQAGVFAFGKGFGEGEHIDFTKKTFDYDDQHGIATRSIFGFKRLLVGSSNWGSLVISTYQ
jgi:N4-gp56 family major capsid protein